MPIIGKVERKNWKVRLLNVMLHVILLIGAATMVYPLLLMLSGSVKSDVDFKEFTMAYWGHQKIISNGEMEKIIKANPKGFKIK